MEESRVRGLLQPGERLLWEGAPEQGIRLQRSDWYTIPFSLVWCGILVVALGRPMRVMAWNPFYSVMYLPFVLAGLYLLIGRFFLRAWRLAGMRYGVTDKRVIIAGRRETVFLMYGQITMLHKEFRRSGVGTIWFHRPTYYGSGEHRRSVPGVGFEEINDAERVCQLIERQMLGR